MKPVNFDLPNVTIQSIEDHKLISDKELTHDLENLKNLDVTNNPNSFAGNDFLYHHQLKNLLKCKREKGKTIYEIYEDPIACKKLIESTRKRNRGGKTASGNVWEAHRINTGSIVMFKSSSAKYLYSKYGATQVLDPTAGWGGRLLGAWVLGIDYTGIDTNINMKSAYDNMFEYLNKNNPLMFDRTYKMIWESCLDVDYSKIDYDFVLTSPPYINMELYEHMEAFESGDKFYKEFFIPLWNNCMTNIKKNGHVCFNISPIMYENILKHGIPTCDIEEDLKQQTGANTTKKDKIYIWKC